MNCLWIDWLILIGLDFFFLAKFLNRTCFCYVDLSFWYFWSGFLLLTKTYSASNFVWEEWKVCFVKLAEIWSCCKWLVHRMMNRMSGGIEEDKEISPMFPRLHVKDAERGGPKAPPRNKMALYEQFSLPSQNFAPGSASLFPLPLRNYTGPTSSSHVSQVKFFKFLQLIILVPFLSLSYFHRWLERNSACFSYFYLFHKLYRV